MSGWRKERGKGVGTVTDEAMGREMEKKGEEGEVMAVEEEGRGRREGHFDLCFGELEIEKGGHSRERVVGVISPPHPLLFDVYSLLFRR